MRLQERSGCRRPEQGASGEGGGTSSQTGSLQGVRGRDGSETAGSDTNGPTVDPLLLVLDALAVYRLTRLVVTDTFGPVASIRERLLARWPGEDTDFTEVTQGEGGPVSSSGIEVFEADGKWWPVHPHWLGGLISCYWCAGFWVAVGVVAADLAWEWWVYPAAALAVSTVVGLLSRLDS